MLVTDIAHSAGDHDGFMVAAHLACHLFFISAEIAAQIRTAKFIIKCGRAYRSFHHDLQGGSDARGYAVAAICSTRINLPGLLEAGNIQIGNRKTGQSSLGLGAAAGRAFVADFTS